MPEQEYEFKIQAQGKSATDAPITIGKAPLDIAKYCTDQTSSQNAMLPITFKVGGTTTGYLKMTITSVYIADADGDGLTEVSGMTGLTSEQGIRAEQDLDGEPWGLANADGLTVPRPPPPRHACTCMHAPGNNAVLASGMPHAWHQWRCRPLWRP